MDFSDSYPVWSTGDNLKINALTSVNDLNANNLMNMSDVPAWETSVSEAWAQVEYTKMNGGSVDAESSLSGGISGPDSGEATPAWATNPLTWDHDSATRLAEKLLPFQADSMAEQFNRDAMNKDMLNYSQLNSSQYGRFEQLVPSVGGSSNPRFKTEFCRNFREKGDCVYGSQCQFAHGKAELRHDVIRHSKYKTKLCQKYWINGWCAYGTRCNFIHQEENYTPVDKSRMFATQSGFRPLLPGRNLRKSSESSADSGVDFLLNQGNHSRAVGEKPTGFATRFESDVEFYPSNEAGNGSILRQANFSKMTSLNVVDDNASNMNLASELNRNFFNYLDIKVKDSRSVPHPEDNPIAAPAAGSSTLNKTMEYRMLSGSNNRWAF